MADAAENSSAGGGSENSSQPPTDLSKFYTKLGIDIAVNTTVTLSTALLLSKLILRNSKSKFLACGVGIGLGIGWSLADASVSLKTAYAKNTKLESISNLLEHKTTQHITNFPLQLKNFFSSLFK